jgi:hypothetical protein
MRLNIRTETFDPAEDHSWLGSQHGTENCDPVTLNGDAFLATFTDGVVPSGVVLGRVTATGRYVPYSDAAVDGSEVARGHLFTTIDLGGTTAATVGDTPAALYWHGEVVESKLPTGHGLDAAAKTDLSQIRYV